MAKFTRQYHNARTGQLRAAPVGFAWTVFFFGAFPALFRRDWFGFLLMFLCAVFTLGLSYWVFMFTYNGWYERRLQQDGFSRVAQQFTYEGF
jgi:hypothetical protein